MPEDDFTISVANGSVDVDMAPGRPWAVGVHTIHAIGVISAVASGTADSVFLKMGRESIPVLVKRGATVDTDTDVIDNRKLKPVYLVNVDAQGNLEVIQLVANHADAAAKNHRARVIYD